MTAVTIVWTIALTLLAVAGACCLMRLLLGPTLPDRIVALDALLLVVLSSLLVQAARSGDGLYLVVVVVVALVGFVGTVTAGRFVERRGA